MAGKRRLGSVADAAAERGVSESTVRSWIRSGSIQAERVGQRRYVVDLDSGPIDPRREAFARALATITADDVAVMRDLAGRLDESLGGEPTLFALAWDVLGTTSRHSHLTEKAA